jgi:hypothetical protein
MVMVEHLKYLQEKKFKLLIMYGKKWTDQDIKYLKMNFANTYTKDICAALNKSYTQVAGKSYALRLKKSPEFLKMELGKQAERLKTDGASYRFKKGSTPPNKGKPMPEELYKRFAATMYQKGHEPHNLQHEGAERITKDGYIQIRISKNVYKLKHRVVYEQHHGPIPDDMKIRFKDGNRLNVNIENLELVSNGENMAKNTIMRFPKEVRQTIRILNKIKKVINEKQD